MRQTLPALLVAAIALTPMAAYAHKTHYRHSHSYGAQFGHQHGHYRKAPRYAYQRRAPRREVNGAAAVVGLIALGYLLNRYDRRR